MASQFPRTIKPNCPADATLAEKAFVFQETVGVAAPTTANDGLPVASYVNLDLILIEDGGGTYDCDVWWFYADADVWVQDTTVGTISTNANTSGGAILSPSAASKVAVELFNFAGGGQATVLFIGRGSLDKGR